MPQTHLHARCLMCVILVSYLARAEKFIFKTFNFGNFLFVVFARVFGVGLDKGEFMLDATELDCKLS